MKESENRVLKLLLKLVRLIILNYFEVKKQNALKKADLLIQ